MPLPTAQNKYLGNKWNAQIQYARDQYSNSLNSYNQQMGALKFNTWGNAADSGNTRGSYNGYALAEGKKPLDTSLSAAQQQRDMTIAEIQRARAAAAAAAAARKKAEAEAKAAAEKAAQAAASAADYHNNYFTHNGTTLTGKDWEMLGATPVYRNGVVIDLDYTYTNARPSSLGGSHEPGPSGGTVNI